MTRRTVELPRGALLALVVALVASVLGLVFLVGRESAKVPLPLASAAAVTPLAATASSASATGASAPIDAPLTSETTAPALPASPLSSSPPPVAVAAAPQSQGTAPEVGANDPMRQQVARYFRDVEAIQSQAKSAGDPEGLAQALLEQGAKGDLSGLDALAAGNRKVRDALLAMPVPEPCREHQQQTLALLEQSLAMLERVKAGLGGEDQGGLAALPEQGRALEQKAKDVDALAADIKRRFGL